MTSAEPAQTRGSAANAGIDLALRMGGLLAAIIVVAVVFIIINPNVANLNMGASVLRSMSSVAIMAPWR
jgi:ribose/xylose/arabinose/galactoside ABC-type transport system permease subunit